MKRIPWAAAALLAVAAAAAQVAPYKVEGDGIPQSLTGKPGNAANGRALLVQRQKATCLACHAIQDPDMKPGGTRGPALDGVGAALTPAQLRLSVVDYSRINRGAAMPSFHRSGGDRGDQPALTAQEVEDIVAYLATLRR
jgi:sulfur-oxidizing protein SoxX